MHRAGCSYSRLGQLDDLLGRRPGARAGLDAVLLEDRAALLFIGTAHAHHERQLHLQVVARSDQAFGDLVPTRDPTEDVHQHSFDAGVHEDHGQRVLHHLGFGAATDVAEVGRPSTGPGDEVERVHAETGAVSDDPDVAVQRDVGQAALFGLDLVGIAFQNGAVTRFEVLVAPGRVLIGLQLGVAGDDLALGCDDEWVDLRGHGIQLGDGPAQLFDERGE